LLPEHFSSSSFCQIVDHHKSKTAAGRKLGINLFAIAPQHIPFVFQGELNLLINPESVSETQIT